jgi:hypothetical protein
MLQQGFPMWSYRNVAEITWTADLPERWAERLPSRLGFWRAPAVDAAVLLGMGALLLLIVVRRQQP